MADPVVEYFEFSYPRRSSDFCLRIQCPPRMVFGVADMIGHPHGLRWRNYIRVLNRFIAELLRHTQTVGTLDEIVAALREHLLWHDRQIYEFRMAHDRSAFGFCLILAVVDSTGARLLWLGDCRAYRVRRRSARSADRPAVFDVECLTKDHNALGQTLEQRGELTVYQAQLPEMTKRLGAFLGIGVEPVVRGLLEHSVTLPALTADECLLLMTDGIYMPHLRAQLEGIQQRLSRSQYYLETWFADRLSAADERIPLDEFNYWPELATVLVEETLDLTRRRRHYRDDMALVGMYLAEPE